MGNYVGVMLEERIALGNQIIRVITRHDASELVRYLWDQGYGVTSVDASGENGPVKLIFMVVKRRHLEDIVDIIKRFNPNAFYTIEDVRFVRETFVPPVTASGTVPFRALRIVITSYSIHYTKLYDPSTGCAGRSPTATWARSV